MTTYRTSYSTGLNSTEHYDMRDAEIALRNAMGWDDIATSSAIFALGMQEGQRGSIYGVECYPSDEACDAEAHEDLGIACLRADSAIPKDGGR